MSQPPEYTEAVGIFQGDLIVKSAIIQAINDLRANPYLLDYVFASLPRDPLTANEYGAQEVARAKEWFKQTKIHVFINIQPNEIKFPCISIGLSSSSEDSTTLGDVHYVPAEDTDVNWPVIAGPLSPVSYDPATGLLTIPSLSEIAILVPGMLVVDKTGTQYPIVQVVDDTVVQLATGIRADFDQATIRPSTPAYVTQIESVKFKEIYNLGCHADSEVVHMIYLHSILVFALLRYKQDLLEARGLERTSITSTDLRREDENLPEFFYTRYLQLAGFVQQSWPKITARKITSAIVEPVPDSQYGPAPVIDDTVVDLFDQDPLTFKYPQ